MSVEDVIEGMRALNQAAPGYECAAQYAQGDIPERFASPRLRQLLQRGERGYLFRFAAKPVTVMANRVQVSSFSSDRGDTVNETIEAIRQANDMELIEPYLTRKMFTYGDAYLMVYPTELLSEDAADNEQQMVGVEITYQSPLSCRAMYDSEDGRRVRYVIRRWKTQEPDGESWSVELWYSDVMEAWKCKPGDPGLDPQSWIKYAFDEDGYEIAADPSNWPVPHEFGQPPILHARTDLPYGRPEHIDAYGPQDAITKAIITQVVGIESAGWPERYRIMDDASMLDTARDAVAWDDSTEAPDAPTGNVEVTALRRGPGTESKYYGTKTVGQFQPPDIGALSGPIDQWIRLMATVVEIPLYEFDPRDGQQMSGIARLRADAPLRAKERDRKRFLTGFWRGVWSLALTMANTDPGDITVNWTPPEVISDPEWWAVAESRVRLGVPVRRVLEEANYLPDEVERWLDDIGQETTLDARIARLAALGDALQKIGTAGALGTVDSAAINAMIERVMAEASTEEDGEG